MGGNHKALTVLDGAEDGLNVVVLVHRNGGRVYVYSAAGLP